MIEIREFSDVHDEELSSTWESLSAQGLCPNLFMSYPWVATWAEHLEAVAAPAVVVGYSHGDAVGIAPLFRGKDGRIGFPISPNPMSLRGELIVGEAHGRDFGVAVLEHLGRTRRPLQLRGVPRGSITYSCLADPGRSRAFIRHERTVREAPYIDIGTSWEEYLATRPRKVVHEWERKIRKIERAGGISVRTREGEDVESLVGRFVDVEGRSWKEEHGSSIGQRGVASFYIKVARLAAERGWFLPFWLELDGRIIAFVYGFVFGGAYWAIKTSYDQEHAELAPGVRLFYEVIGHTFRTGLARFDFVGHRSRWTGEWATGWLEHVDVALYPRSPNGVVAYLAECWAAPALGRLRAAARRST
jgi:CelD/BcsL family acetyltransferase involved in cellulose biosynthesis